MASPLWSARPELAAELMPRTLPRTFWMDENAFLEVFNTLYAVDLGPDGPEESVPRSHLARVQAIAAGTQERAASLGARQLTDSGPRERRCEGSWDGEACGGR